MTQMRTQRDTCPSWCVRAHGVVTGEDDWVHIGSPLIVSGTALARLCMTVEPHTHVVEGPYIMVGSDEFTIDDARSLGEALIELADSADVSAVSTR